MSRPTGRQAGLLEETYRYIEAYIDTHRIPPTEREIGAAAGRTGEAVGYRLKQMEALGWIRRDGRKQSIVLMGMR